MSPGLLGIKTRPQLNKISLSLPHIDPWAHIHGHILYIDIHTQICIHTCTHPVMPQWAPCHNEGPCMYVTMNKTLLCEVYYWCKGDNIFCCWGSKRQNLFFHRFSCQCVWPSHTHTHRSSYTVHKCKCILMSSYPANTSEVNTHTHTHLSTDHIHWQNTSSHSSHLLYLNTSTCTLDVQTHVHTNDTRPLHSTHRKVATDTHTYTKTLIHIHSNIHLNSSLYQAVWHVPLFQLPPSPCPPTLRCHQGETWKVFETVFLNHFPDPAGHAVWRDGGRT